MAHSLRFRPLAKRDLQGIYDYIADHNGAASARRIVGSIESRRRKLQTFPNRGTPHPELRPGLRTVPLGKAVIAYLVEERAVVIVRIRYAGQQLEPRDVAY